MMLPAEPLRVTYRFGPFVLDTARRVLLLESQVRPLPEKLFQILTLLLEANGTTVAKESFFSAVWGNESVTDANLTQHIFMLRQILGERAGENAYIVTVAGKGYRFAVPIETKLGLIMKGACERCGKPLAPDAQALICSYECTFCTACANALAAQCPNCGGELVFRPRRHARSRTATLLQPVPAAS